MISNSLEPKSTVIIDPLATRTWISMGIEVANHAPIEKPFNLEV